MYFMVVSEMRDKGTKGQNLGHERHKYRLPGPITSFIKLTLLKIIIKFLGTHNYKSTSAFIAWNSLKIKFSCHL